LPVLPAGRSGHGCAYRRTLLVEERLGNAASATVGVGTDQATKGEIMTTIAELRDRVRGPVIERGQEGYEEHRRVYNFMHDRHPAVIVRATATADIVAAVNHARDAGLDLAVRGGGHSVPGFGTCDDGVVIDLALMSNVFVDPARKTARAGGGATWGDFNHATHAYGLATTGGIISTTGVTGLTLGGGIGYLARGCGLSCDNVVGAEVVTADGRILAANEYDNEDLFWALRGGGGNFGVVSAIELALHPVDTIYGGPMFFEVEDAPAVMASYRDFIDDAPDQMGAFFAWQIAPPLPFIPADRHGDLFCVMVVCWSGPLDQAEQAMSPLRAAAEVKAEHVGPMPYPALTPPSTASCPEGFSTTGKLTTCANSPTTLSLRTSSTADGRPWSTRPCTCTPSMAPSSGWAPKRPPSATVTPSLPR
jgi:hypothetical protein